MVVIVISIFTKCNNSFVSRITPEGRVFYLNFRDKEIEGKGSYQQVL